MSSNNDTSITTPSSIITTLELVDQRFVNQLPLVFIILGSIGFIGNAFTFLQPTLRWNTFCIYSLCGSVIDVINLFANVLTDYIYLTGNTLILPASSQLCKWKLFGLVFLPQLSMNLLVLSLIDRYSCTCGLTSPMRKICQLKRVPYLIGITIIISALMSLYGPLLYDFIPGFGCILTNALLNGVLYIVIHGCISPMMMLIFVSLTYRNVKRSRQRVGVVVNAVTHRPRQHFINTVFTQVIVTSFLVLQWISMYLYNIATQYENKSVEQWAINYFVYSLTSTLYYLISVKSFYMSTLTSRLFRETFIKSFLKLIHIAPEQQRANMRIQALTNAVR